MGDCGDGGNGGDTYKTKKSESFFDEIQAPLLEVHERVKADMKVHAQEGALTDLSMKLHYTLNIFTRYRARENSWTRRLVGQAGF